MNNGAFPIYAILYVVVVTLLVVGSIAWTRARASTLLTRWAAANGYQLLAYEPRYLRAGPYFWRRSRSQMIYYITVLDPSFGRRSGYVRLGSWFFGLLSDKVDVSWES